KSYTANQSAVVTRNPNYWDGPAKVSEISVSFISDPNSRILALRSGQIDLAINPDPSALASLTSQGYQVLKSTVGQNYLGYLNIHGTSPHDILQDANVRKALSLSCNRTQLVNDVLTGQATFDPAMGPLFLLGPSASTITTVVYDPTMAKSILDSAGWTVPASGGTRTKAGRSLTLALIAPPTVTSAALEFIQAQAGAVGINVTITSIPDNATYSKLRSAGTFDIDLEPPNQNDADPAFLPILRFYVSGGGAAINYFAPGGSFNTLAQETLGTDNLATIQKDAAQMMNYLVAEQNIVIAYAGILQLFAATKKVQGFVPHPSLTNQYWNEVSVS
ncbi:MAG: ABC transporter substrate-binding protein, partial [Acidimicrobiales bacterium]